MMEMKYIKLENNNEIHYRQPLVVDDRLYFTDDPEILAEHGYLPLIEAVPEERAGFTPVRHVERAGDVYREVYDYVESEVSGEELLAGLEAIL